MHVDLAAYNNDGTREHYAEPYYREITISAKEAWALPYAKSPKVAYLVDSFGCGRRELCDPSGAFRGGNSQRLKNGGRFGFGSEQVLPNNMSNEIEFILAYAAVDTDGGSVLDSDDNCESVANHKQLFLDND